MGIRELVKSKSISKDAAVKVAKGWLRDKPWNTEKINRLIRWIKQRRS